MNEPLLHSMNQKETVAGKKKYLAYVLIVVAGIVSGLILSKLSAPYQAQIGAGGQTELGGTPAVGGLPAEKVLRDSAEGTLEGGGIDGEGTHKLIRPGGVSQTVYLTSSLLDLEQYVGKKVKVWGETFAAKKAGWLMDVGKVEVVAN